MRAEHRRANARDPRPKMGTHHQSMYIVMLASESRGLTRGNCAKESKQAEIEATEDTINRVENEMANIVEPVIGTHRRY